MPSVRLPTIADLQGGPGRIALEKLLADIKAQAAIADVQLQHNWPALEAVLGDHIMERLLRALNAAQEIDRLCDNALAQGLAAEESG